MESNQKGNLIGCLSAANDDLATQADSLGTNALCHAFVSLPPSGRQAVQVRRGA